MVIAALAMVNGIKIHDEEEDLEFSSGPDGLPSTSLEVYKKYTVDDS